MQMYSGLIGPVTLVLAGLLWSGSATAEDRVNTIIQQLQGPNHQARIDPYSFYQYLESVQYDIESAPERVQTIYLLRKAEAELMQYRFDDFS